MENLQNYNFLTRKNNQLLWKFQKVVNTLKEKIINLSVVKLQISKMLRYKTTKI
jgi:hypothetical protein